VSLDYLLTGAQAAVPEDELLRRVAAMDHRLELRRDRPFSRQELAVLFAAMLLEQT
jgi:hypothetical protein